MHTKTFIVGEFYTGMNRSEYRRGSISEKKFWRFFLWLLVIVIVFTLLDTFVHAFFEPLEIYYYPIPSAFMFISTSPLFWYAVGKLVGTTIMGSLLFFLVKRIDNLQGKVLTFTLIIVALIEVRYILSGYYSLTWDTYNVINHFITLYIPTYIVFKKTKCV